MACWPCAWRRHYPPPSGWPDGTVGSALAVAENARGVWGVVSDSGPRQRMGLAPPSFLSEETGIDPKVGGSSFSLEES